MSKWGKVKSERGNKNSVSFLIAFAKNIFLFVVLKSPFFKGGLYKEFLIVPPFF
jgi:hypothetical protein